jgi:protein-L-isoaspartate(D-aspartate) O-methyltransferase
VAFDDRLLRFVLELRQVGVTDARVLAAIERTPRAHFAPEHFESLAYEDAPLPIGHGQQQTRPSEMGCMLMAGAPNPQGRALLVGAGSGYFAAILAQLCAEVTAFERVGALAGHARAALAALRFPRVSVSHHDGARGAPAGGKFDAIFFTCAIPTPGPDLMAQLTPGGALVAPVGPEPTQRLMRYSLNAAGMIGAQDLGPSKYPLLEVGLA